MNQTPRWFLYAALAAALAACRQNEIGVSTAGGSETTKPAPVRVEATTATVFSAADLATTTVAPRVPAASLRALADPGFRRQRLEMVAQTIAASHPLDGRTPVRDPRVLDAMRLVPRQEFVPREIRRYSYADDPLPIGHEQTISQPYIVALMTELLKPRPGDRVLEIGTGSGYQAAVLSLLVKEVYTIEIVEPLAQRAEADLKRLGYDNVRVRCGDGYRGWPEAAPFDSIIVTAAPERIPPPLVAQLRESGRIVMPIGSRFNQELVVLAKSKPPSPRAGKVEGELTREVVIPVRFVPMVGEVQKEGKN